MRSMSPGCVGRRLFGSVISGGCRIGPRGIAVVSPGGQAVLIVHADAVTALLLALQGLQSGAGVRQVAKCSRRVGPVRFADKRSRDDSGERPSCLGVDAVEDGFGSLVAPNSELRDDNMPIHGSCKWERADVHGVVTPREAHGRAWSASDSTGRKRDAAGRLASLPSAHSRSLWRAFQSEQDGS